MYISFIGLIHYLIAITKPTKQIQSHPLVRQTDHHVIESSTHSYGMAFIAQKCSKTVKLLKWQKVFLIFSMDGILENSNINKKPQP